MYRTYKGILFGTTTLTRPVFIPTTSVALPPSGSMSGRASSTEPN